MEFTVKTTKETEELVKQLAKKITQNIKDGFVIALYGDLGSGKTTFTRYLTLALGVNSRVQSPTFVLARKYISETITINHLDLYRLKNVEELVDLDLPQFFTEKNSLTLIEWPQLAEHLLPKKSAKIYFTYLDENSRRIDVQDIN